MQWTLNLNKYCFTIRRHGDFYGLLLSLFFIVLTIVKIKSQNTPHKNSKWINYIIGHIFIF